TAVFTASPRPKSASGAVTVDLGEPSMPPGAYVVAPTTRLESEPVPIGTVESTFTPGAASSTSALYCEKLAHCLLASTPAMETTLVYPAGYDFAVVPALPAAAIDRMPASYRFWKVLLSSGLLTGPPSDIEITFAPAAWHFLAALASVDEYVHAP